MWERVEPVIQNKTLSLEENDWSGWEIAKLGGTVATSLRQAPKRFFVRS